MSFLESKSLRMQEFIKNNFNHIHTMGLMNRSYLGGFRVNPSPTYVTLVTILFHAFST